MYILPILIVGSWSHLKDDTSSKRNHGRAGAGYASPLAAAYLPDLCYSYFTSIPYFAEHLPKI